MPAAVEFIAASLALPGVRVRPSTDTARRALTAAAAAALLAGVGCHHRRPVARRDEGPPPVQVVTTSTPYTPSKPLPPQDAYAGLPPAYADPAIVRQQPPEEPRYVQAYNNIGRPKVIVFVNRTITGELVPVNPNVTVRSGLTPYDDRATTYLRAGQYDEAQAKSIDYETIEILLTEDLSADGKVTLIAPTSARQRLSNEEVSEVQAGRPQMLGELATKLNADVLVQVTARPSQQTDAGLGIRLVAQALNTHGGQAIAFASVDVPPPLTTGRLNEYVRFVSRKLMDGMSGSWEAMAVPAPITATPAPRPAPPAVTVTPPPAPTSPPAALDVPPTTPAPIVPQLPASTPPAPSAPSATTPAAQPTVIVPAPATPPPPSTRPANPLDLPPPP